MEDPVVEWDAWAQLAWLQIENLADLDQSQAVHRWTWQSAAAWQAKWLLALAQQINASSPLSAAPNVSIAHDISALTKAVRALFAPVFTRALFSNEVTQLLLPSAASPKMEWAEAWATLANELKHTNTPNMQGIARETWAQTMRPVFSHVAHLGTAWWKDRGLHVWLFAEDIAYLDAIVRAFSLGYTSASKPRTTALRVGQQELDRNEWQRIVQRLGSVLLSDGWPSWWPRDPAWKEIWRYLHQCVIRADHRLALLPDHKSSPLLWSSTWVAELCYGTAATADVDQRKFLADWTPKACVPAQELSELWRQFQLHVSRKDGDQQLVQAIAKACQWAWSGEEINLLPVALQVRDQHVYNDDDVFAAERELAAQWLLHTLDHQRDGDGDLGASATEFTEMAQLRLSAQEQHARAVDTVQSLQMHAQDIETDLDDLYMLWTWICALFTVCLFAWVFVAASVLARPPQQCPTSRFGVSALQK